MKILVTGGAGFIGSNFVRYFMKKHENCDIVVLDKLTYAGRKENLQDIIKDIEFVKGDICDSKKVQDIIKDCDFIINFAAETHVDRSIQSADSFVRTDILGVFTLLEASRKYGIRKFVQISTDEVYGHALKGSFREADKLNPGNPYSASKSSADLLVLSYFKTYGLPVIITRSTNNYGYYHHPEKFIPKTIIYALLNKRIPVYGKGKNIRDWLFVEDNCSAIDTVLWTGNTGEIYNIGSGNKLENIEVVRVILKKMGMGENLIEFVKDRPGHDIMYSLNTDKINGLGWKPGTGFDEGVGKTIKWFKDNRWWWEPVIKKQDIDFHKKW